MKHNVLIYAAGLYVKACFIITENKHSCKKGQVIIDQVVQQLRIENYSEATVKNYSSALKLFCIILLVYTLIK